MTEEYVAAARPLARPAARYHGFRELREDNDFYIPDFLSASTCTSSCKSRRAAYSAADDHAAELRKAERRLDEALNLARVLRASLQEADDSPAMQAETVLNIIEKKLEKAHTCIDRHGTRHRNLFLAYFDLKNRMSDDDDDDDDD